MEFLTAHGPALLFYVFALLALVSALGVVVLRNPMYGALSLLVSFLSVAVLFFLRNAEFVAAVQIFVYAGGIMVLFLFVIMLINLHRLHESRMTSLTAPLGILVGVLLVALFVFAFVGVGFGPALESPENLVTVEGQAMGNSEAVAWLLYREYLLPFEIASIFLLVAMVGAVILGRRQ